MTEAQPSQPAQPEASAQPQQAAQPASEAQPEAQAQPVSEAQPQSAPEDTFSNHPEVGEIIVDDHNRPFLVLDVNENDGSVIGLAFNVDGTSEVVTERADHAD